MRMTQAFGFRSKRVLLLKVALCLMTFYCLCLILQTFEILNRQAKIQKYPLENDIVKIREIRKVGLQLNWISSNQLEDKGTLQLDTQTVETTNIEKSEEIHQNRHQTIISDKENKSNLKLRLNGTLPIEKLKTWNRDLMITDKLPYKSTTHSEQSKYSIKEDLKRRKEELVAKRRKYIFALRYYEQLARATKNLIALSSLARHFDREIVMPFINNSRMNGIQFKTSQRGLIGKFSNLSRYFDITHLNSTLKERGYAPMAHFNDFLVDCNTGFDIVIHFLYNDSFAFNDAKNWFGMTSKSWNNIRSEVFKNDGFRSCEFLRKSGIERLLGGIAVRKYMCVDPEMISTAEHMERTVLKGAQCVGIIQWKGGGDKRTHFPLPKSVYEELRPSEFRHNPRLIDIARDYTEKYIKYPFLAVHIRAENQMVWRGMDKFLKCTNILSKKVFRRKEAFKIKNIFLATDLPRHGSDTFQSAKSRERALADRYVTDSLRTPITFQPELYGLYDKGEIAIIEMNILSFGESLYTLGGGNFQEWVVDLFLVHNAEDRSLVHKICTNG